MISCLGMAVGHLLEAVVRGKSDAILRTGLIKQDCSYGRTISGKFLGFSLIRFFLL